MICSEVNPTSISLREFRRAGAVVESIARKDPMRVYGFYCKTPGCKASIVAGELPEDSVPINIGDDPRKLPCRDCKQVHDYYFSEHEIFLTVDIKAYTEGYSAGSSAAELWNEDDEVPNPIFEEHETPTYQKGWWDGFNKLEYDPGGQGLFARPERESR
jgi:hypothetical protein